MYKITICAICKNEIDNLLDWYDSVKDANYVCVLDTGSTDGTWEKLQTLPIISQQKAINPWSFGVARAEAWKLIPKNTDLVFILDLDERLSTNWRKSLDEEIFSFNIGLIKRNEHGNFENFIPRVLLYNENITWKFPVSEEPFIGNTPLYSYGVYPSKILEDISIYHKSDITSKQRRIGLQKQRINEVISFIKDESIHIMDRILIAEQGISLLESVRSSELRIEDYSYIIAFLKNQPYEYFLTQDNYSFAKNLICLNSVFLKENPIEVYQMCWQVSTTDLIFAMNFLRYFLSHLDKNYPLNYFRKVLVDFEKRGISKVDEACYLKTMIADLAPLLGEKDFKNLNPLITGLSQVPFKPFKYTVYIQEDNPTL